MFRSVTVGLDGSRESRAAAEWAAREAKLRGLPLTVLNVSEPVPAPLAEAPLLGAETLRYWTERIPRDAADGLRARHPGIEVSIGQLSGDPGGVLASRTGSSGLLVLGSRGLGGLGGFLVGSVGLSVVAHATGPVVLVRALESAADEHESDPVGVPSAGTLFRPVVLGLDADHPDDTLVEFAFDAARSRATSLRVVHGWSPRPYFGYGTPAEAALRDALARGARRALSDALSAWRGKYPDVEVTEVSRCSGGAVLVVTQSQDASLVVVGRRMRRGRFGAHIGHVTHAVLHHGAAPVAVVPHR